MFKSLLKEDTLNGNVINIKECIKNKELNEFGEISESPIMDLGKFGKIRNIGIRFVFIKKDAKMEYKFFKRQRDFFRFHRGNATGALVFKCYVIRDERRKNFIFGDTLEECMESYFLKFSEEKTINN